MEVEPSNLLENTREPRTITGHGIYSTSLSSLYRPGCPARAPQRGPLPPELAGAFAPELVGEGPEKVRGGRRRLEKVREKVHRAPEKVREGPEKVREGQRTP